VKTPIATNLYYNTAVPSNAQVASHVKNQLGQLGFNVALKGLDFSVYYDTIQNPKTKAQFGFAAWSQDFPDAITFFQPLLHSSAAGGGSNYGQFKNPQVDKEIARISKLPSGEERNAEFAKLSTQVMQEHVPWAVYRNRKNVSFTSNKLGGFAWHPAKNFYYRLAYVKQ
jgi:ABC-type transport system substrate-binding protein